MTSAAEIDIEAIVREVVRRLRDFDVAPANRTNGTLKPTLTPGDLTIDERLVTLDTLHNRLDNVQRVVVTSRAIVTPAVIDELKDRGIALTREGAKAQISDSVARASPSRPTVQVAVDGFDAAHLSQLLGAAADVNVNMSCPDWQAIASTRSPSVLLTSTPVAVVVSANRHQDIRGAVGLDFPTVRRAVDEANANFLAIDPRGKATSQLFGLINEFLTRQ